MTQPNEVFPRDARSSNNLPSAIIWSALGLTLLVVIGFGVYYTHKGKQKPRAAQPARGLAAAPAATNATVTVAMGERAYPETLTFNFVPRGLTVCDGTTFQIEGALRTCGLAAGGEGKRWPGAVLNIPVNRQGSRIHLLQACEYAWGMTLGAPYAHFVLHYADGKTHHFDLNWGIHGFDWFRGRNEKDKEPRDENTRIGWEKQRADGMFIRLYHTTIENPYPNVLMTSFDVISPLYQPHILLFGFTVDNDPRPLADPFDPSELPMGTPVPQTITFYMQDGSGKALPDAKLSWTAVARRGRINFPPFSADASGQVKIEVPRGSLVQILYKASAPDGKEAVGVLRSDAGAPFPETQVIELKTGDKDAQGAVVLSEKAFPETQSWAFLPNGPNVLDGTSFFIDGAIKTAGLSAALDPKRRLPGAILDIPVNRRGSRIHLLQGAEHGWTGMPIGAPYAHFVLHYADGKTHRFELNFGVHGWDWGSQEGKPEQQLLDKNTHVAWSTPRPPSWPTNLTELRMWRTTLENPFPDVAIKSFDVSSPLYAANLVLFGFTVDSDTRPLARALERTDLPAFGPPPQTITFTLQDEAGKPLPEAKFSWTAVPQRGRIVFPPMKADASGQVKIEVPRGSLVQIVYKAIGPQGKEATWTLQSDEGGVFPEKETVELKPATGAASK